MKVRTEGVQVCELTLACEILYKAGCGRRRTDVDHIGVYLDRPNGSFYVSPEVTKDRGLVTPYAILMVDEGSYSGALHLVPHLQEENDTVGGHSLPWCEYVDMGELMRVLVRKLCGEVKYEPGPYISRGKNQRHEMEQSITFLRKWSEANRDHKLKFI